VAINVGAKVALLGLVFAASAASPALADAGDGPGFGPRDSNGPGCNVFPASASVGTRVGLSYFGPPPSETNPSLVGPVQVLRSGKVDAKHGTITLPLYLGYITNTSTPVWYIVTDTSDQGQAAALGLNYSAKLQYVVNATRTAHLGKGNVMYFDQGTVDFSPHRVLKPGSPEAFPPSVAQPGSVGDANYSPYIAVENEGGTIYNAPVIAFGMPASGLTNADGSVNYNAVHDEVVGIDVKHHTVTLNLVNGFSFGRPVWYISMESNDPTVAAIEGNTYAPLMRNIKVGGDDSLNSAVERIFIATNGASDCNNPQRQGLDAAITDNYRPNNTLGGIPTLALDYSPAWDINLYEWSPAALTNNYRQQLREEFQILTYAKDHLITGPGGKKFGSSGFVTNCPIVQRLD
jgi:hypothetical protein